MFRNLSKLALLAKRPPVLYNLPQRSFGFFFPDFQRMADRIKEDVERQLDRQFQTFEVIDDPEFNSYRMRIRVDDNGHVRIKTIQKDPGSDWRVQVEEYDRGGKKAIASQRDQSITKEPEKLSAKGKEEKKGSQQGEETQKKEESELMQAKTSSFFSDMQRFQDKMRLAMENRMKNALKQFDFDKKNPPQIGENATYRMKMEINDNGHVTVKTAQKDPGSDWVIDVEEYDEGKKSIGGEKAKSLEGEKKNEDEKKKTLKEGQQQA